MIRLVAILLLFGGISISPTAWPSDLELEPVHLFKCWRALRKLNTKSTPIIPDRLSKSVDSSWISVPVFKQINSKTVQELFNSPPNGDLKARGLSYRSIDGSLRVLFWPLSSSSPIQSQISFRDAIETILTSELKALDHYLSQPKNNKLELLLDTQTNLSHLLKELKNNSEIPLEIRERFLGFHLTAAKSTPASSISIETIEFDPSVNARSSIGSLLGWHEDFQSSLNAISKVFSSKYTPKEFRVDPELVGSYLGFSPLSVPSGSKVIGFKKD